MEGESYQLCLMLQSSDGSPSLWERMSDSHVSAQCPPWILSCDSFFSLFFNFKKAVLTFLHILSTHQES